MSEPSSAISSGSELDAPAGKKSSPTAEQAQGENASADTSGEYGGPKGPEPTRYGDWEKAGRCIDF